MGGTLTDTVMNGAVKVNMRLISLKDRDQKHTKYGSECHWHKSNAQALPITYQ